MAICLVLRGGLALMALLSPELTIDQSQLMHLVPALLISGLIWDLRRSLWRRGLLR